MRRGRGSSCSGEEINPAIRWTLDGPTPTAAQVATRLLRLLAHGTLPVLLLLHVDAARADTCDQLGLRQICTSSGEFFCGGDRIAGCLHATACCPDAGCCLTSDENGVLSASCCPSGPDYTGTCNGGQCQFACNRPCGSQCCLPSLNEVCIPPGGSSADGTCCPVLQVCGVDTASPSCCQPPDVCTPAGTCCAADQVCGNDCCPAGVCCNGTCCNPGSTCYGDSVCCPQSEEVCGDSCCARNQRCRRAKHKAPACKCKKKGRKCGKTRCCVGDVCLDGVCASPLP